MAANGSDARADRDRHGTVDPAGAPDAPGAAVGGLGAAASPSLKSRFEDVYRHNRWGDGESASGAGSRLDSDCVKATEDALAFIVGEFAVSSILDAPCGDFNWMHRFLSRHPGIDYEGLDIVEDLVRSNGRRFPAHRFRFLDLTETVPPRADLILCKDLVNHLTHEHVCRVLHNFRASGSRLLLLSNNEGWHNEDLPSDVGGQSRHLDVTRPPFALPRPIWSSHYLALWHVDQIPRDFVLPAVHHVSSEAAPGSPEDHLSPLVALMDATPPLQVFCDRTVTGIALFGPYVRAKAGRYRASFRLHCATPEQHQPHPAPRAWAGLRPSGEPPVDAGAGEACARVEVTADLGSVVICEKTVAPADLRADPRVVLEFELASERVLELRVDLLGRQDMIVDHDRHLVRLEQRFHAPL